jgi:N-acetylneuraminic acid mutarotase
MNVDNAAAGWSAAAELPAARKRMAAVELGGKLYAIGGHVNDFGGRLFLPTVHAYDPALNKWRQVAGLPDGRSHFHNAVAVVDGNIVVAGGKTAADAVLADVLLYDPIVNRWRKVGAMPESRNSGLLASVGGELIYTTGSSGGGEFRATTHRGTFEI